MPDEYMAEPCDECGERRQLDSGPLGVNCFSEKCVAKATSLARRMIRATVRAEIARLQKKLDGMGDA